MAKKKIVTEEIITEEIVPEPDNSVSQATADISDEAYCYTMQQSMSLDEIQDFVDDISNQFNSSNLIQINLGDLETVSTATVQAVISLNRYACDNDKKIKWQNPTTGFSDAFNNLGFYSEMMKLEFA
jgi:hypothetical protein